MFLGIIDRYILKKYLSTFFFVLLIFSLISVVIDFSEKLDDYIEEKLTWKKILLDYYAPFIPHVLSLLFPLFSLIAVIFFTSRLATNSEIIAMTAGGANFYRLLKPYVIGAFIIGGLHLVLSNYIVPNGNKKRTAFENQYIWKNNTVSQTTNIHMNLSPTEAIYMSHFYADTKTGTDFTYEKFDAKGELVYKLKALQIVFTKDNKWRLTQCNIKTMDGLKETLTNRREIDTTYQFSPNDFVRRDNFKETMTSSELKAFIDATKMRGLESPKIYEVELYKRTAEPFSILILTLIGVAVASRKVRGGMGWHLLTGAVTGGIFIFMTKFSSVFSTNASLPPSLGVWMPNIIFGAITLFLLTKAQK